jgi:hypothetical protein
MLTRGDDFPIHQTPEPIAFAGSDRNFYDRYFFNGYSPDGSVFFAAALGVYPQLNVMDAAFSIISDGVQRNVHASKLLNMERMDISVGPIRVEVIEPLQVLRLVVDDPENNIHADLTFRGRTNPIEEPRFTRRNGPRLFMDYTRLTQNGDWDGRLDVKGREIDLTGQKYRGTRDRSWGIRSVGLADPQPAVPESAPQFYWLWSPLNFEDRCVFFHSNEDGYGEPWNKNAVVSNLNGGFEEIPNCSAEIKFKSQTRHAETCVLNFEPDLGSFRVELTPKWNFYMKGIGYGNAEWGHGQYKGELAVGYDEYNTADVSEAEIPNNHIQAFCDARLIDQKGDEHLGVGILEQLIIGHHEPSDFETLFDLAP